MQGAWRDDEQHLAPVCGLLVHAIEQHDPRPDLQLAKITFDALGVIPLADSEVAVRTLRPGRSIEQVEATLKGAGRAVVRATAWRLAHHDTSAVAGGTPPDIPGPQEIPPWTSAMPWRGGYIDSLEMRLVETGEPGRRHAWLRARPTLVAGEQVSDVAAFLALADTANGIAARVGPAQWMFPNVDLTVHLFREPVAGWVGFDTIATFGRTGLGVTSTTLYDIRGPVGRAEQSLTVRPGLTSPSRPISPGEQGPGLHGTAAARAVTRRPR